MADNIAVTSGTGTSIATDEVGGAHYQRVKVTWGADGVAEDVALDSPLPVVVSEFLLPEDAATETTLSAISEQLALLDGAQYETIAAGQTAQVLGTVGATGDDVDGLLVIPATTSPGQVLLLDNASSITVFVGGPSSVSDLRPFHVPLHIRSVNGPWKVTTGADVSVVAMGKFS